MTKYSKLIEEIRTIRDFKKEPVDPKLVSEIIDVGKNAKGLGNGRNITVFFVDNGTELVDQLSGKAGYFGKVIEAPHYLVISTKEFQGFMENSGYIMELMRLKAWELGLGSCWLSIGDEEALKKVLRIENQDRLTALAAIGYQYKGIFKKDISLKSGRYGIEELVFLHEWGIPCPIEYLDTRGITHILHYTKFAPSWGNRQPWRFIVDGERIILAMEKDEKIDVQLDGGIIMLYLEKTAMEEGIVGKWTFEEERELRQAYKVPEKYKIIASFRI